MASGIDADSVVCPSHAGLSCNFASSSRKLPVAPNGYTTSNSTAIGLPRASSAIRANWPRTEIFEKAEMDALLAQPDRRTPLGDRDHALLLFLYNSGARADEAARLTIDSLQLGAQSSVRLHGKGNKFRICPLWPVTATSLLRLVANRGKSDAVFLNRSNQPLTRFGIHRLVTQYAERASRTVPWMATKRVLKNQSAEAEVFA